jgi:hypothetical protein
VGVQEVRWQWGDTEPADNSSFVVVQEIKQFIYRQEFSYLSAADQQFRG